MKTRMGWVIFSVFCFYFLTGCNKDPRKVIIDYTRDPYHTDNATVLITIEFDKNVPVDYETLFAENINFDHNPQWNDKSPFGAEFFVSDTYNYELGNKQRFAFKRSSTNKNRYEYIEENALLNIDQWKDVGVCPFSSITVTGFIDLETDPPISFPDNISGEFPCKLILPKVNPKCAWFPKLIGTWYYQHTGFTDYMEFDAGGDALSYRIGSDNKRIKESKFSWTCLDNGQFKNLTEGSVYTITVDQDRFVINGDTWRRLK